MMNYENNLKERKVKRKWNDNIIVLCFVTFLIKIISFFILCVIANILLCIKKYFLPSLTISDMVNTMLSYGEYIVRCLVCILYIYLMKKNRPILRQLGRKRIGNTYKNFAIGLLIGFFMNGVCVLAAILHKDFVLTFDSFHPLPLFLLFICVLIQSSTEEVLCRGFLYERIRMGYGNPAIAIIGNALVFGMLHLMSPGITFLSFLSLVITGIMLSMLMYYTDSIWISMALHTAWNYTQAMLFGLPNSGTAATYSVWKFEKLNTLGSFAYDPVFGIEGSVLCLGMDFIICIVLYCLIRKDKRKTEN